MNDDDNNDTANNSAMIDLHSPRAQEARLRKYIGTAGERLLWVLAVLLALASVYCIFVEHLVRISFAAAAVAGIVYIIATWHRYRLQSLPVHTPTQRLDDLMKPGLLGKLRGPLTPRSVWEIAITEPDGQFVCNHLLMHPPQLTQNISNQPEDMAVVWQRVAILIHTYNAPELDAGLLVTAIILESPGVMALLVQHKVGEEDVLAVGEWLERQLSYMRQPKPYFGGIGRDWATGFTPTLEHFGQNLSQDIQHSGGLLPHRSHIDLIQGVVHNLVQGSGIALVGYDGAGKTALVQGLAERLIEGQEPQLAYYQIVSLNASMILSYSGSQLEQLVLTLFGEAIGAGNIILFLDDAHLFFGSGLGAFDMGQILLPVLKNRNLKIIAAFTPSDWQHLQNTSSGLTTGFTPITVNEPDATITMEVLEDLSLVFEHRQHLLISHEALREAYRLSGQYMQEQAYPGKAVTLLEQAFPYATQQVLTAEAVQAAIEKTKGVRVSAAQAPEADMLLHLEDRIHERMINQKRAVNVIAAALRRGRAGVSSPKRPVGSFLFLGPTGVGKTELARSLAAVYFGDEQQMIRLDMSEYQQAENVSRLLSMGGQHEKSLLSAIREQPFSVVLLDEVEKAHPNILNLLLQMLDEGQLTDEQGRPASFRSAIIIATSNAGAVDITAHVRSDGNLEGFERPLIDKLIAEGQFKPELVNRFDEVVLFRPLTEEELGQVAQVMLQDVNKTLATQHVSVTLTDTALKHIVHAGYDPEFGARPMRRIIQKTVENAVAVKILQGQAQPGSIVTLDINDLATTPDAND